MTESNIALSVFIDALLSAHRDNVNDPDISQDQVNSFTESEIIAIAENLWIDKYSETRKHFQSIVGNTISSKVKKI